MASIRKEISTKARLADVWAALRDVGALHTRLVPGFVTDTRLESGARIVTFGNGMVVREQIVTIDDDECRVVWSAIGQPLTHHNASAQAVANANGETTVVWIADLLPDEATATIASMMEQGATIMKQTLDRLADQQQSSAAFDDEQTFLNPDRLSPLWRAPGTGPTLDVLGVPHIYKAMANDTGHQFSVWESIVPPGAGTPAHTHTREDEAFYVLSGELLFEVEGAADPLRLGPGGFLFAPRNRRHGYRNTGTVAVHLLVFAIPGAGLDRMFAAFAAAGKRTAHRPAIETIAAIAEQYGVVIHPPAGSRTKDAATAPAPADN
jgi:quercetin dioxygenase-like cupin family protein